MPKSKTSADGDSGAISVVDGGGGSSSRRADRGGRFDSIVVLGPTACGKTALAVHIARLFSGEIISADSRQVYRGLDIGAGKDLSEYGDVPYHLIDIVSLPDEYNVFRFQMDFFPALDAVRKRNRVPVVAGGTGLYLDSVISGYRFSEVPEDPVLRGELETLDVAGLRERLAAAKARRGEKIHPDDTEDRGRLVRAIEIAERSVGGAPQTDGGNAAKNNAASIASNGGAAGFSPLVLGVRFPRDELRGRIKARLDSRIAEGLLQEVEELHEGGISWERLERLGLEYRFVSRYLQGGMDFDGFRSTLLTEICRFAKRQDTWFRRMERRGVSIEWIDRGDRSIAEKTLVDAGFRPA